MTNREAIKVIEWIKNTHPEQITREALNLAVSALEKQAVDKCCETCKHKNCSVEEPPCCDCYISTAFDDSYEPYTEEES